MTDHANNKIGYARVSTTGQNLDSQLDALKHAGCSRIFADKASGIKEDRPEWTKLMEYLRPGDTLVVTELSRMTRSLMHLLQLVQELEKRGINLVSLCENIDTRSATGRAFLSIIGVINQMERELKAERTAAGRASAKARGRTGGRPRTDPAKLAQAHVLYENSGNSAAIVCKTFAISRRTFFNYLAEVRKQNK
jgi:DNA invertase Pin-like site-specific DNA recombinase